MRRLYVSFLLAAAIAMPAVAQNQAALQAKAKITLEAARQTALAKEPGTVKSEELEKENGKLIYSFDISTPNGTHEVAVDAITGTVVADSVESAADEAKEAAKDKKDGKKAHHKHDEKHQQDEQ
ncbi:MAG TPA: PepSY domain-containing protein [Candidatus Dormibacteraeota bacterium]|nr:PepSY domain-containing protein [Candidatus Dormibacteraeota bacterium]